MAARRVRGFSLIEGIVATSILGLAVVAMFAAWIGLFSRFSRAREVAEAGELARAEIERAKSFGPSNLPLGTYSSSTNTASWTGAFDPTANAGAGAWVSGHTAYFNGDGTRLGGSNAAGVKFRLQLTIGDSALLATSGGGYGFDMSSQRRVQATVTTTANNDALFTAGTVLVPGGV